MKKIVMTMMALLCAFTVYSPSADASYGSGYDYYGNYWPNSSAESCENFYYDRGWPLQPTIQNVMYSAGTCFVQPDNDASNGIHLSLEFQTYGSDSGDVRVEIQEWDYNPNVVPAINRWITVSHFGTNKDNDFWDERLFTRRYDGTAFNTRKYYRFVFVPAYATTYFDIAFSKPEFEY